MIVERNDTRWRKPGLGSEDASVILELTKYSSRSGLRKSLAMRILDLEQGTKEWHEWRNEGIVASESASVLGLSSYKSRDELLEEKASGVAENGENEHTRRGKAYEPEARAAYEQVYGWKMKPVCVVHDQYPFIKASLDGLRDDGQLILEIKCPTERNYQNCIAGQLPDYWRCQAQHQLLITQAPTCHFLLYRPKGRSERARWKVLPIQADPEFQEILLSSLVSFWDEVGTEIALRRGT